MIDDDIASHHGAALRVVRERDELYSSLYVNSKQVMLLIDPETGDIVDANPAACAYYGYRRAELTTRKITDVNLLTPEETFAEMARANAEQRNHFYFRHRVASGEIRDVEVYSGPIVVDGRSLLYSIVHDITERKQAEEALRASELFARSTLDGLSAQIAILDGDGVIIAVNKAWRTFTGANHDALMNRAEGANYLAICDSTTGPDAEHARAVAAGIRSVAAGERDEFTHEYPCHAPSERRWFVVRITRFPGTSSARVVVAHENVTERRLAEEALSESEQRFRGTFEQAAAGIAHVGLDGRWLLVNRRLCDMLGYTVDELLELTFSDMSHPDDDGDADRAAAQRLVTGEIQTYMTEKRYCRKDGSYVWTNLTTSLMRPPTGAPAYFISVIEDISERKRSESLLREIQETERRRIARDLHDVVLQDLVYALQSMQITQLRLRDTGDDAGLGQEVDALRRAVQHLRGAIYNLRLDGIHDQPFTQRAQALIEMHRQIAPELGIHLAIEPAFPHALPILSVEELLRILQEALVNVRRHSGAREVWVTLELAGDSISMEVVDNGRGFDVSTAVGGVGQTGMRERATALGGDIEIQSSFGAGSRLRFTAPLAAVMRT